MKYGLSIDQIIDLALKEDIGNGDHTSLSTIDENRHGKVALYVKEEGVLAGCDLARQIYYHFDPKISIQMILNDGVKVKPGDIAFFAEGKVISLLSCERLVLNFMQRMSGIATRTNKMTSLLEGTKCKVLDTRKTTPLLRELEKAAVKIGGGENHRFGLYDMVMIKDNHVDFAGGIQKAIEKTSAYLKVKKLDLNIEIEVRSIKELEMVLEVGGVQRVMLDNFTPEKIKEAVAIINGKVETEASGGITLENVRAYAEAGVDYISSGALTHHIKSMDLSLKAID